MNNPIISIIAPCYNEEETIEPFLRRIEEILTQINEPYEIVFINDGSRDNTLNVLLNAKQNFKNIRIINFSRNFGKEAALTAGLDKARGEAAIPIDVDLQDPPELIKDLVARWREGYDVVLAKRADRTSDSFAKRVSADLFYKLNGKISNVDIPNNVGDFRLMSKRVVEALKQLPENQRFMKGLFAWVGFKTVAIEYVREKREAGQSSFNGWKLWNFALDGITSFSTLPLRIWLYIGALVSFLSFLYGSFIILKTLIFGVDLPGYASLAVIMLFLGGIQLIGIGILGEYIGRIYSESKRRPSYIIEGEY
ncbi:glycosyltransferase family 2 protein [uncultured Campylobacter sp.]|jgi:glycosyltransferase, family 2|uniref:glycosyltransferase family 2 protein n=1 Tax=uncultured Campylobacter sp. TaxID=218934 RepID=UPI0025D2D8DC|nr:glycosyltransferase family 2 protein [uncultured Campylobacter sp.]